MNNLQIKITTITQVVTLSFILKLGATPDAYSKTAVTISSITTLTVCTISLDAVYVENSTAVLYSVSNGL